VAEIVLAIGTSHGPLLSTPPEQWDLRAEADRANKQHYFRGRTYNFQERLDARPPGFAPEIAIERRRERYTRCQNALDTLAQTLKDAAPDALVIIGNDQQEMFSNALRPSLTIYRGKAIANIPFTPAGRSPGLAIAEQGNCPPGGAIYEGASDLADHVIESLGREGFDPAQASALPEPAQRPGIPHAYGFVYHRLLADAPPPSVPVILNVHYPPNCPSVRRCLALGEAVCRAVETWGGHQRVALIASGGLTHFVVDEEFDARVLHAMEDGNQEVLAQLPEQYFRVGTAEIKNWLPVIGAMISRRRRFHKLDYVPCYRSEAGTGNAMAFVYWD